jgi:hypothetical protein
VTSLTYNSASNTISAAAVNVLFPSANDRAAAGTPWSISEDGAIIATLGSNASTGDLVVVPVDPFGAPYAAVNVAYPFGINVPALQGAPAIDPRCDWIATAGDSTSGDLVLTPIERSSTCVPAPGLPQAVAFAAANNFSASSAGPIAAPSGQFILALGQPTIGDLVIVPLDDARIFALDLPCVGRSVRLRLRSAADPLQPFVMLPAGNRCLYAVPSTTFVTEIFPDGITDFYFGPFGSILFGGFMGTLDQDGLALATFFIPPLLELRGAPFYFQFGAASTSAAGGVTLSAPAAVVPR